MCILSLVWTNSYRFKIGMQKGIEQRNVEIARKMLEAGMAVDVVMEMTGLSEDTVRRLR